MVGVGNETTLSYTPLTLKPSTAYPGKVLAIFPDGRVKSVQPNGAHETRPAGTDGPFEAATVDGKSLIYAYAWGPEGQPKQSYVHVVSLLQTLPALA
jgi:hypothetical protein